MNCPPERAARKARSQSARRKPAEQGNELRTDGFRRRTEGFCGIPDPEATGSETRLSIV